MASKIDEKRVNGFTLIEVMVIISIVAILTAIAIPGLQFMKRSNLVEMEATLTRADLEFISQYSIDNSENMRFLCNAEGNGYTLVRLRDNLVVKRRAIGGGVFMNYNKSQNLPVNGSLQAYIDFSANSGYMETAGTLKIAFSYGTSSVIYLQLQPGKEVVTVW